MTLRVYYALLSVQRQYGIVYNDISVYLCEMCIDISTDICYNVIVEMGLLIKPPQKRRE